MSRIFLSYSRSDEDRVAGIAAALERAGHEVWWDRRLTGGAEFEPAIEQALADAEIVVVAWSDTALKSHWVRDEAAAGRDSDRLVPVTLDGSLPPLGFRQFHTIDLSDWSGDGDGDCPELEAALAAKAIRSSDPGDAPAIGGKRKPSRRRLLPVWAWLGITALVIVGALASWLLLRPPANRQLTVALGRFEAVGAGVPAGVPASLDSELRTAFGEIDVPLKAGDADLLLSGTIRRVEGNQLRVAVRVVEAASGTMLWSRDADESLTFGQGGAGFARWISFTLDCALTGAARRRGRTAAQVLGLTLESCSEGWSTRFDRQLAAARRLARADPGFWMGWYQIAYAITGQEMLAGGVRNPALFAEAMRAAERVIALQPNEPEGYCTLAQASPPQRPAEREALFRRAAALHREELGCAAAFLGDFLLQVGRLDEAAAAYRDGAAQAAGNPLPIWRAAMADYLLGRIPAADQGLRQAIDLGGDPSRFGLHAALWTGRWQAAAQLLSVPRPDEQAVLHNALMALASGEGSRIAAARAAVERLPGQADTELIVIPILAALGGTDSVFERLEASRARGGYYSAPGRMPGYSRPLLFDPLLRPLFDDPRFPAFLRRAGFIAYWRQSRSRPDVCRGGGAPAFCRLLG